MTLKGSDLQCTLCNPRKLDLKNMKCAFFSHTHAHTIPCYAFMPQSIIDLESSHSQFASIKKLWLCKNHLPPSV